MGISMFLSLSLSAGSVLLVLCGRSTFAVDGPDCKINADVERVLKDFHKAGKPIGSVLSSCVIVCLLGIDLG